MTQSAINVNTPVRLLMRANREFDELKNRLEVNNRWKTLMLSLPHSRNSADFGSANYRRKYTLDQARLIEKAASDSEKTCTEFLIDEWGTSTCDAPGNFPTIGELIRFLVHAGLYIPAVYLANDLLNDESLIVRPSSGPAATVVTTLSEPDSVERIVADAEYPENFEINNDSVLNRNLDHQQSVALRNVSIPAPLATPVQTQPLVSQVLPSLDNLLRPESEQEAVVPVFSDLAPSSASAVSSESESVTSFSIPNIVQEHDYNIPNIVQEHEEPDDSQIVNCNLPNLSVFGNMD